MKKIIFRIVFMGYFLMMFYVCAVEKPVAHYSNVEPLSRGAASIGLPPEGAINGVAAYKDMDFFSTGSETKSNYTHAEDSIANVANLTKSDITLVTTSMGTHDIVAAFNKEFGGKLKLQDQVDLAYSIDKAKKGNAADVDNLKNVIISLVTEYKTPRQSFDVKQFFLDLKASPPQANVFSTLYNYVKLNVVARSAKAVNPEVGVAGVHVVASKKIEEAKAAQIKASAENYSQSSLNNEMKNKQVHADLAKEKSDQAVAVAKANFKTKFPSSGFYS